MIVRDGSNSHVEVGAVTHSGQAVMMQGGPVTIGAGIPQPDALSWYGTDDVIVLADSGSSSSAQLYEVPLNGGPPTVIATPGAPVSVTATSPEGSAADIAIGLPGGEDDGLDGPRRLPAHAGRRASPRPIRAERVAAGSAGPAGTGRAAQVTEQCRGRLGLDMPKCGHARSRRRILQASPLLTFASHRTSVVSWHPPGSVVAPRWLPHQREVRPRQADASRRRNGPRKATYRRLITVRLRSKSCPAGGPDVSRAGRRAVVAQVAANPSAGGCGVEDQVGRAGAAFKSGQKGVPQ